MSAPSGEYPSGAIAYGQETMAAWVAGGSDRLAELTTPEALAELTKTSGPADPSYRYALCEGAAGSQYCTFFNGQGDELLMRMRNEHVGHAHAVIDVRYQPVAYPPAPDPYVESYLLAWMIANWPRMGALCTPEVLDYVRTLTVPVRWTLDSQGATGHTYVHITNPEGFDETVRVTNAYLRQPHAITDITD